MQIKKHQFNAIAAGLTTGNEAIAKKLGNELSFYQFLIENVDGLLVKDDGETMTFLFPTSYIAYDGQYVACKLFNVQNSYTYYIRPEVTGVIYRAPSLPNAQFYNEELWYLGAKCANDHASKRGRKLFPYLTRPESMKTSTPKGTSQSNFYNGALVTKYKERIMRDAPAVIKDQVLLDGAASEAKANLMRYLYWLGNPNSGKVSSTMIHFVADSIINDINTLIVAVDGNDDKVLPTEILFGQQEPLPDIPGTMPNEPTAADKAALSNYPFPQSSVEPTDESFASSLEEDIDEDLSNF